MKASSSPGVYFDSSVFVAVLLGPTEPRHGDCLAAVTDAQEGITVGFISSLVVAEVVGAPKLRAPQGVSRSEARRRMATAQDFFRTSGFRFVEAGRREGLRAAEIAQEFDMKGADALHVALAESARCRDLFSLDHDQLKVADGIAGLVVRAPIHEGQVVLDLKEAARLDDDESAESSSVRGLGLPEE